MGDSLPFKQIGAIEATPFVYFGAWVLNKNTCLLACQLRLTLREKMKHTISSFQPSAAYSLSKCHDITEHSTSLPVLRI